MLLSEYTYGLDSDDMETSDLGYESDEGSEKELKRTQIVTKFTPIQICLYGIVSKSKWMKLQSNKVKNRTNIY